MKTCIIGLGLIGSSLALDLRKNGFTTEIIGVDSNPAHIEYAMRESFIDYSMPLAEAVLEAELIVLCIPVDAIKSVLPLVLDSVSPSTVVVDMGSTKAELIQTVQMHPLRKRYVAAHPMAGTECSGPYSAHSNLFNKKTALICDMQDSDDEAVIVVEKIFESLGMRVFYMDAQTHDLNAAYFSHLSHIIAYSLALTVINVDDPEDNFLQMAGGGFDSTVRIAASPASMWIPIFMQNRDNMLDVICRFEKQLQLLKHAIDNEDVERLDSMIVKANSINEIIRKLPWKQN